MHIGLVLAKTPEYSETFFRSKISGLQEAGFEVTLFVNQGDSEFDLCDVCKAPQSSPNIIDLGFTLIGTFIQLLPHFNRVWEFWKLERKRGVGILQILKTIYLNSHILSSKLDWLHFGFATLALGRENIANAIGAKMAVSFRGFDMAIYPLKYPNCYDFLWEKVTMIHTISSDLLERAYELGLKASTPVQKITPAIDTEFFTPPSVITTKKHNQIRFLTVGRLHWKKGYIDTLQALKILKDKGVDFHYMIIGGGSKEDEERIGFAVLQLGLKKQVTFAGIQEKQEVRKAYQNSDIYLQYSISEGFCNAVLEAQGMGLQCIVSDGEGLAENVLNKETGWVVTKASPKLLAEQISTVLALPEQEKNRIIQNAKQRVVTEFNIKKQQEEFVHFYTRI